MYPRASDQISDGADTELQVSTPQPCVIRVLQRGVLQQFDAPKGTSSHHVRLVSAPVAFEMLIPDLFERKPGTGRMRLRPIGRAAADSDTIIIFDNWAKDDTVLATITSNRRLVPMPSLLFRRSRLEHAAYHRELERICAEEEFLAEPLYALFLPRFTLPRLGALRVDAPPWAFYALHCPRQLPPWYFPRLLEAAAFWRGADDLEAALAAGGDPQLHAIETVMLALCLPALATDYAGDRTVRGDDTERMFHALGTGEGDCEDQAKQIQETVEAVQRLDGPIPELVRQYTPVMITGLATTPAVRGAANDDPDPKKYICHVWTVMIENDALAKMEAGEPAPSRVWLMEGTGAAQPNATNVRESFSDPEREMAIRQAEREFLETLPPAVRALPQLIMTKPMEPPTTNDEQSDFYYWALNAWTPRGDFRIVADGKLGVPFWRLVKGDFALKRTWPVDDDPQETLDAVREAAVACQGVVWPPETAPPMKKYEPFRGRAAFILKHIKDLTPEVLQALRGYKYQIREYPLIDNVGVVLLVIQ